MSENKKNKDNKSKVELATRVATQSKRVANSYVHIEDGIIRIVRWASTWIDRILFKTKYTKFVTLVLAVLIYLTVNYNDVNRLFGSPLVNSKQLNDVPVTARYNSEAFELSGLPESVNITITGEGSNVNAAASKAGSVVADLEGLTEGTHLVRLKPEGYGDNVNVSIDPSNVQLTIKKKTTAQFMISHEYINSDKMNSIYSLSNPEFEVSRANVRASKDTLDSIAFIKALIDVANVDSDFTQEVPLIAYNKRGQIVDADIVPNTVNVTVHVSSPSKNVPIVIETTGEIPDGRSIANISKDRESVLIYAPDSVLGKIDRVTASLDAGTLTQDVTSVTVPIALPSQVNSSDANRVVLEITLGETASRTVENVPILYKNNNNNLDFSTLNNQTSVDVTIYGVKEKIDEIDANSLSVYFDMTDATPGTYDYKLFLEQSNTEYIRYELSQPTLNVTVIDENAVDDEKNEREPVID